MADRDGVKRPYARKWPAKCPVHAFWADIFSALSDTSLPVQQDAVDADPTSATAS